MNLFAAALAAFVLSLANTTRNIDAMIRAVFGAHGATAVCISHAEDPRRDPRAISRWGDVGIFQVNPRWHPYSVRYLQTVSGSIRAAYAISRGGTDWSAWTGTYGVGMCHGLS